jgi:hypothetical protein
MFEHVVALSDIFISLIVLVDNQYIVWHCGNGSLTLCVCVLCSTVKHASLDKISNNFAIMQ